MKSLRRTTDSGEISIGPSRIWRVASGNYAGRDKHGNKRIEWSRTEHIRADSIDEALHKTRVMYPEAYAIDMIPL